MLGFIKRCCREFSDPYVLKSLYCAFVRSQLEYASVVWNPYYDEHSNSVESVQKRFVLYALRKLGWTEGFQLPPYMHRCQLINLESLKHRREIASVLFIFDLLSNRIDAPNLLSLIDFSVPSRRLRNPCFLRMGLHRTNYGKYDPLKNMSKLFNYYSEDFDFGLSHEIFKSNIRSRCFRRN